MFADVDEATRNLTVDTIDAGASPPRTKAVIVVHQAGVPADLDAIHALVRPPRHRGDRGRGLRRSAPRYRGSRRSARGPDWSSFSFHPRKVITTGEGGMLTTDDEAWAARGAGACASTG